MYNEIPRDKNLSIWVNQGWADHSRRTYEGKWACLAVVMPTNNQLEGGKSGEPTYVLYRLVIRCEYLSGLLSEPIAKTE